MLRLVRYSSVCILLHVLQPVSPAHADAHIHTLLVTTSGTIQDTLLAHAYLRGPWLKRTLEGEGLLADLMGERIEILNRATGDQIVVLPEERTYVESAGEAAVCGPMAVLDMRWLGRVRDGVHGDVVLPGLNQTLLGVELRAVDIRIASRHAGGSTLRFWIAEDLEPVFGPSYKQDLFCGDAEPDVAALAAAELLGRQFGLSDVDRDMLASALNGFPLLIESFVGNGDSRIDLSRLVTQEVVTDALSDSVFLPPPDYIPVE
jgi:hypothetical protein